MAIIVADKRTDASGEAGWSMETFAQCDPAEFPAAVTDELGIQVWVDRNGERVPTMVLRSARGAAHCDWDSATFLDFNGDTYIKDPQRVLPAEWFNIAFDADVTLPHDARDTGYRLDRQELWLAPDGSAAYIVTEQGVERWPAATGLLDAPDSPRLLGSPPNGHAAVEPLITIGCRRRHWSVGIVVGSACGAACARS